MYLGDMGADVLKIENPKIGDGTRYESDKEGKQSLLFELINRNKKAVTLNLKRPEGKELLFKMAQDADILVEGFRPGAMAKMGLDYDTLQEHSPHLIYCAISGYGATGPYRDLAGHDANYLAYSGVLSQMGPPERPSLAGVQLADIAGGSLTALSSILAALFARERTGQGQFLDISMMDGAFALQHLQMGDMLQNGESPNRGDWMLSGGLPNYRIYETKDGRFVVLAALEERFFRHFLHYVGLDDYAQGNLRNAETLSRLGEILTDLFARKELWQWQEAFSHPDLCLAPVKELDEAVQDPQLKARGMVFEMDHPEHGKILQLGAPFPFSKTPVQYRLSPPRHGEHNREVYGGLGLSSEEMDQLRQKRVI
jgi:crotonobetainyl-CoA:carnitine CoA-transferase CaiB-like acyl-CoA transferase